MKARIKLTLKHNDCIIRYTFVFNLSYSIQMKMGRVANIVLIENNSDDIRTFTEVLAGVSRNIFLAIIQDGSTALKMLGTGECLADLIFLNTHLPDMNGIELLAKFRRLPILVKTPVVVFCNDEEALANANCQKLSIVQFIQKGTPLSLLESELRSCLHKFAAIER